MAEEVKLALIPPVSLLEYTDRTDYHLMLPQLMGDDKYARHYEALCQSDDFVILDNGLAEGYKATDEEMIRLAMAYEPDEVVIPDIMKGFSANIRRCQDFLTSWYEYAPNGVPIPGLMFVLQGQNIHEFVASGIWALGKASVTTIGIPRHAVETCRDSQARSAIANTLHVAATQLNRHSRMKPIHFLGGTPSHMEEIRYLANEYYTIPNYVRGMDTSMPFNCAFYGCNVEGSRNIKRPENYFNLAEGLFDIEAVRHNIDTMMGWAGQ